MYLGPPCYGFALNCHLVYLALPGTVMYEKAKFVYFIYMQPQKVKFKYVQINMKQVSYHSFSVNVKIIFKTNEKVQKKKKKKKY